MIVCYRGECYEKIIENSLEYFCYMPAAYYFSKFFDAPNQIYYQKFIKNKEKYYRVKI